MCPFFPQKHPQPSRGWGLILRYRKGCFAKRRKSVTPYPSNALPEHPCRRPNLHCGTSLWHFIVALRKLSQCRARTRSPALRCTPRTSRLHPVDIWCRFAWIRDRPALVCGEFPPKLHFGARQTELFTGNWTSTDQAEYSCGHSAAGFLEGKEHGWGRHAATNDDAGPASQ